MSGLLLHLKIANQLRDTLIVVSLLCLSLSSHSSPLLAHYKDQVLPILKNECLDCHNASKKKGGLDLSTFHGLVRGGLNGSIISEGNPLESGMIKVLHKDADPHMPPKSQLSEENIYVLKSWVQSLPKGSLSALRGLDIESLDTSQKKGVVVEESSQWTPPSHWPPARIIDYYISLKLDKKGIVSAPLASDRTFVRRAYLDLIGRVPSIEELERFLYSSRSEKRSDLVSHLLDSAEYPIHMAEIFDTVLMSRRGHGWESKRKQNKWFAYLEEIFRDNRPWIEVVSELIEARPNSKSRNGAVWFLYERENNYQAMAEAIAPVAFGTQMKCAQCHDHPLAHEIKQSHYWAMVSAFNRSKNTNTAFGPGINESAIGGFIKFANLKKESQQAKLSFFNGAEVEEAIPDKDQKEIDSVEKYLVSPALNKKDNSKPVQPKFSRRGAFAMAVTDGDNILVAKGMVNRIWAHLLGRGLVHPVDEINSFHPASHPELLDWLSNAFVQNNFDIRWLIETICATKTYQLSRHNDQKALVDPSLFAGSLQKPISAESIWRSIITVTKPGSDEYQPPQEAEQLRRSLIEYFPDLFPVEFNATMQQAMFLSNSRLVQQFLIQEPGNIIDKLIGLKDVESQIKAAFRLVLLRNPDAEEIHYANQFLRKLQGHKEQKLSHFIWALINNPEFLMNH